MNNILKLDRVPNTTGKLIKKAYSSLNIWGNTVLNYVLMSLFVITDYTTLVTLFDDHSYAHTETKFITSLALAVALDVPLAMAACCIKEHIAGMRDKDVTVVITVAATTLFIAVFSVQFWYKIRLNADGNDLNLLMALLPLFTSIASFTFSFYSYSPHLESEKKKLIIDNDAETMELIIAAALEEAASHVYDAIQRANENAKYADAKAEKEAISEMMQVSFRKALAERMTNPESTENATKR